MEISVNTKEKSDGFVTAVVTKKGLYFNNEDIFMKVCRTEVLN